ncbi:serine hydrolase domain-containing protein [Aliidiomarina celeris]|uniref:serine hydrolase domain-containing protein n=1 Tax=Aliidiomarina celeris TaxID=2249428 RepID=UPI000DEAEBE5|nr:serine hydrolase domain-containing protein [Aliidiomarina celeris]
MGEHGGAVALITQAGSESRFFGQHNEHTRYEIGSVTKTMVAYLLAEAMVNEQLVATTPVHTLWPEAPQGVPVMSLVTHTSGIPRLPENLFDGADMYNPYAHYDSARMNQALASLTLQAPVYEYSNFAFGLLGELLARQAETDFAALMAERVFAPAGMANSYVAMASHKVHEQLAEGHDLLGESTPAWRFQALAGAGAVVATLSDMVNYVRFMQQGLAENHPVVAQVLQSQDALGDCCEQAMGWIIAKDPNGKPYAWHNGQTAGFASFVGFYLDGSRAVVLLNNQSVSVNEPALALLTGEKQLSELP